MDLKAYFNIPFWTFELKYKRGPFRNSKVFDGIEEY